MHVSRNLIKNSPFSDKFELHDEVCALAQFKSFGALGSSIPINFADNFYI
jgi:hypothetical protein